MGVQIVFNYQTWAQLFPQFSNINQGQVTSLLLPLAESYCRNDGGGPVNDPNTQQNLINLMIAHLAQLFFGSTTQSLSPLVGRVSEATQGSVNVVVQMPENPGAAWFNQTTYGAAFWAMSSIYRRFRVVPHPHPQFYGRRNSGQGRW